MIPVLEMLDRSERTLIAGCGGGFDVFAGVPIARRLLADGKCVVLANLSFSDLPSSGAEKILPSLWRIDRQCSELPYFPEKWLSEWLMRHESLVPMYAFGRTCPTELSAAYQNIVSEHGIDLIVLVDGGTDSVIFGDEPGLGTVVEDAVSVVAANAVATNSTILASIGFGLDHFHGVSHYSFLENTAHLIRDGGYLGTVSLTNGSDEANDLIDLVEYANSRQPAHKSIVMNSIVSALRGEFGDYHATDRTAGSELFINPLMAQYWFYDTVHLVRRMSYAEKLLQATSWKGAQAVIERTGEVKTRRPRHPIPL